MSHLSTDKDIVVMIGAFCMLIGGIIGFFAKYFIELKKMKEAKKSIRQQMITNNIAPMRQAWINDVRNKASDFLSNCYFILSYQLAKGNNNQHFIQDFEEILKRELIRHSELFFYLQMALPFSRGVNNEDVSEAIRIHIKYINENLSSHSSVTQERHDDIFRVISCCSNNFKVLFKNEWNETKSLKEISNVKQKTEKLQTPECTCSVKNTSLH
ncbi:Uncharacterised protein [Providencia alcalifaciens]|nr:Uncharacterised protein [Providencia alcalifaciens]